MRAEKAATSLKTAGETISDSLLIAMILKGLPDDFKAFRTVITQKREDVSFTNFKCALRSYEESEKSRSSVNDNDNVMKINHSAASDVKIVCYSCGKPGHKKFQCKAVEVKKSRWCTICKQKSHDTNFCRKKNSAKLMDDSKSHDNSSSSYIFKISVTITDDAKHDAHYCNLLVDCGATTHIVCDKSKFVRFDENFDSSKHIIELADGSRTNGIVSGRGDANFEISDSNGKKCNITLSNALYIPSYTQHIFSVQAAADNGTIVNFSKNHSYLKARDGTKFNINKSGKLYYLNSVTATQQSHSLQLWHQILGHCNVKDVLQLENVVDGMHITDKSSFYCKVCAEGKMTQSRNRHPDKRATSILELVHTDLAGPISPVSNEGSKYCISFVDDYSSLIFVYFLKSKSDVVSATERFLADIAPYGRIKRLRSDNGTEYTSNEFNNLLVKNQIKHEYSSPYSAHQNGTAERNWRSLFDMARCLILESKLPKVLWNYAVRASTYIRNRCYNNRLGKTAFEAFTSQKPNVSNMHLFGTVCHAYVQNPKKLDARSKEGLFIGYDPLSPAYLVYFKDDNEVKRVRCVKFSDDYSPLIDAESSEAVSESDADLIVYPTNKEPMNEEPQVQMTTESNLCDQATQPYDDNNTPEVSSCTENEEHERYPKRHKKKPKHFTDYVEINDEDIANCTIDYCYRVQNIPRTYEEAVSSPDSAKWQVAMESEMKALADNNTYELTTLPEGRTIVGGKWVYAAKLSQDGEEKFKARYVAQGYSQVQDIDYKDTFAPTARIVSIRMLMQIAVQNNYVVHQMDVCSAYLNANIDCELYIEQPPGFVIKSKNDQKLVCKLNKSLYGLKQSGRMWNNVLHNFLLSLEFEQSLCDHCVYTKCIDNATIVIIFWVDDLIISAPNLEVMTDIKLALSKRFKMKDIGKLTWFLGIEFNITNDSITMNQSKYAEKLLSKFKMDNCNPKSLPCDPGINKPNNSVSEVLPDAKLFREIVGSLIYLMTCTRPDLCYSVSKLSQKLSKPTTADLSMSKFVLKYVKGTLDYGLTFKKINNANLIGYSDSDWGGSDDRKSISGYCFKLSDEGSLISWRSKKQNTVALSTCEAEYIALTQAVQVANFLIQLLSDMQGGNSNDCLLFVDNQGALELTKNPVYHQRTKHIDIRYHYIRSQIEDSKISLQYIPSNLNVADIFTKPVTKAKLNNFCVCNSIA